MNSEIVTISVPRRFLEHPQAQHIRTMRSAIWLYLVILACLPAGGDTVQVEPSILAKSTGLPEGTIRSWLGHLRKHRYVEIERFNGSFAVRVRQATPSPAVVEAHESPSVEKQPEPERFFTVSKLKQALHSRGNDASFEEVLRIYPDAAIQRALAGALAVPSEKIKRSRTALFIYLLKHDHHARPK